LSTLTKPGSTHSKGGSSSHRQDLLRESHWPVVLGIEQMLSEMDIQQQDVSSGSLVYDKGSTIKY